MCRKTQVAIDEIKEHISRSPSSIVEGEVYVTASLSNINKLLDLAYVYERESYGAAEVLQRANELLETPAIDLVRLADVLFETGFAGWTLVNHSCNFDLIRDIMNPIVGDFVFESTNPFEERIKCVGELLSIENKDGEKVCRIKRLDGVIQEWSNARFVKIINEHTKSFSSDQS